MAVGPFLHILESNLLKAADPATPSGKTRYLAQHLGFVQLGGGCRAGAAGREPRQ